jgi:hypothetical protein
MYNDLSPAPAWAIPGTPQYAVALEPHTPAITHFGFFLDYTNPWNEKGAGYWFFRSTQKIGKGLSGAWRLVSGTGVDGQPFTFECWLPAPQELDPNHPEGAPTVYKYLPCVPVVMSSEDFRPVYGDPSRVYKKLCNEVIAWRPDLWSENEKGWQVSDIWEAKFPHLFQLKQCKRYYGNRATLLNGGYVKMIKGASDYGPKPVAINSGTKIIASSLSGANRVTAITPAQQTGAPQLKKTAAATQSIRSVKKP